MALSLVVLCVAILASRWLPHAANFSPIIGLLFFVGAIGRINNYALFAVTVLAMLISDSFLGGLYEGFVFNYVGLLLAILMGRLISARSVWQVAGGAFVSASLFFLISNFGVWFSSPLYSFNLAGLTECFVMGVPFFRNTLNSTLITSGVLFVSYNLILRQIQAQQKI